MKKGKETRNDQSFTHWPDQTIKIRQLLLRFSIPFDFSQNFQKEYVENTAKLEQIPLPIVSEIRPNELVNKMMRFASFYP